jgi:hypothetical protein
MEETTDALIIGSCHSTDRLFVEPHSPRGGVADTPSPFERYFSTAFAASYRKVSQI